MAPRRESTTSRAQGKRPTELSQPEACRKARFDTTFFSYVEDYQRYKQHFARRRVVPGRNINFPQLHHFIFEGLFTRMGWLPVVIVLESIFPTLVWFFYSRATYGMGGPIICIVRGLEIRMDSKSICCNFLYCFGWTLSIRVQDVAHYARILA